jgi:hypothetical protein
MQPGAHSRVMNSATTAVPAYFNAAQQMRDADMFKKGELARIFSEILDELGQYTEELEDEIAQHARDNQYYQYYTGAELLGEGTGGPMAHNARKKGEILYLGSMNFRDVTILSSQMMYVHLQLLKGMPVQSVMSQLSTSHLNDFAARFVGKFYDELRSLLCDKRAGKTTKSVDLSARSAASAVAGWITSSSGLPGPMASGLAVTVLLLISSSSKGTFCKLRKDLILKALLGEIADRRSGSGRAAMH